MPESLNILPRTKVMTPGESLDPAVDYALAMIRDTRAATLEQLGALTVAELDWAPGEDWNTIGALLSHLIAMDQYFRIHFIEAREPDAAEKRRWMPGLLMGKYRVRLRGRALEDYEGDLAQARALLLSGLAKMTAGTFYELRVDSYASKGYNVAWTMYHLVEDEAHHRGQITLLRKLYRTRVAKV